MKKNILRLTSPQQEYYEKGFDFAHKQAQFKRKNREQGKILAKKFPAFEFKSQKVLKTVPSSPRKIFLGQYDFGNSKKKGFFGRKKNSNSTYKKNDPISLGKPIHLEFENKCSPRQMEQKYESSIKLPQAIIRPTLLLRKQNVSKKSHNHRKAFDKFMKEYATTVGVTNPESSKEKFIKRKNKQKKTIYRTESLASLGKKYGRSADIFGKRSIDSSNKQSNRGQSTASHLSNRNKQEVNKSDQTLIDDLKQSDRENVEQRVLQNDKQLQEQGYLYIEEIMEEIKVLALYSQGIVESYEQLDQWEELIFLVYKKYYIERKKLTIALLNKDIKYFYNFYQNQTSKLKTIWKFLKGKSISGFTNKIKEENKSILESLRNLYNLAIQKSGIFINMNQQDDFHKQIFKLLAQEVQSLEILFESDNEEVTTRLRKNLQCAQMICKASGMDEWKIFSLILHRKKPIKKTIFWKILQYYRQLL